MRRFRLPKPSREIRVRCAGPGCQSLVPINTKYCSSCENKRRQPPTMTAEQAEELHDTIKWAHRVLRKIKNINRESLNERTKQSTDPAGSGSDRS